MDESLVSRWVALGVLFGASAFFSGCEVAFFSLTRVQLDRMKEAGSRAEGMVNRLLEDNQRLLVTIYIGNELVNVAISAVTTFIALEYFGNAGLAVALGGGTFALLVFSEISPKTLAHYNNESWSKLAAYPLFAFMWAIYPVEQVVTWFSTKIAHLFGAGSTADTALFSEDELKSIMNRGADEGVIDEEEKEMIHGVFELGDVTVSEVMTPRTDIFALEIKTPSKEAWDTITKSNFSRAPIYKDNMDNIVGFLFKKDLLKLTYPPPEDFALENIMHEPFIVPETMIINELLRGFKKRKTHMAVAMDEYGAVRGVVTMDDVIEELVGESEMENGSGLARLSQDTFRLPASLALDEFNERFETNFKHPEIETIGGYVFHLFGTAPKWGEFVEERGLKFTVEGLKANRITELRMKINKKLTDKKEGAN